MKKNIIIIFFILFFINIFSIESYANNKDKSFIKKINSFNEIDFENEFKSDEDLILFDIDHTLIEASNEYVSCFLSYQKECNEIGLKFTNEYADIIDMNEFLGKIIKDTSFQLTENDLIQKINILKKNKIHYIAITALITGFNNGLNNTWQDWRLNMLKKDFGFEFSFSDLAFIIGKKLYKRMIFYHGIILTDHETKAKAMEEFLNEIKKISLSETSNIIFLNNTNQNIEKYKNINLKPKRIVLFDDAIDNLEGLMEFCMKNNIIFNGYHYNKKIKCDHAYDYLVEKIKIFMK